MSSIVIVGRRSRVVEPSIRQAALTLDCASMLQRPEEAASALAGATHVVFLGYLRGPNGEIDRERSAALARLVSQACRSDMSRVLYLSTDAVFSGVNGPYTTQHAAHPATEYGRMKRDQELVLQGACVVRFTVFGPSFSDRPLLSDMVCDARPVTLYPNAWFSPVSTFAVNDLLRAHFGRRIPPGLHHLATQRISKASLVSELIAAQGCATAVQPAVDSTQVSDFSLAPSPGRFDVSLNEELARLATWRRRVGFSP